MEEQKVNMMGNIASILLTTDGTEYSEAAVQKALFVAQTCDAKLLILNLVKVDIEQESSTRAQVSSGANKIAPHVSRIATLAESLEIEHEIIIKESVSPAKTIVDECEARGADLIIMGRSSKNGLIKFIEGSVAAKVIGYTPPKVLVVPKNATESVQNLLVALDGSPHSTAAAEEVISMCSQSPAEKKVIALAVAESLEQTEKAKSLVGDFKQKLLANNSIAEVDIHTEIGIPYSVIINKAQENNVDLIAMGGFGKSGIKKLLMGSVTEKVIDSAQCSVLIVNCQGK